MTKHNTRRNSFLPHRPNPITHNGHGLLHSEGVAVQLLRWPLLGSLVGVLAGVSSTVFLISLEWVTEQSAKTDWLLYLLPVGGLVIGLAYHYGGGRSSEGNSLIIDEIHDPKAWVPRRMAPMVLIGTLSTHLLGGSAGREGTAVQMSGSLTDGASRILRLNPNDRRVMLIASIAGGFGAVFGVPLAGAVFALEVQSAKRVFGAALVASLTASVVGNIVVHQLGVHHSLLPQLGHVGFSGVLIPKVMVAAMAFGIAGAGFIHLTHSVKHAFERMVRWAPARPVIGGFMVIALTLAVGDRTYNGLSLDLIDTSLHGGPVPTWGFALKLVFTALTLGSGFVGGEVTPLFVIGATLGVTLAGALGAPLPLFAALGFVAVFAGAANTPIACTIMGLELFGPGAVVYFALACVGSYIFSTHHSIYAMASDKAAEQASWLVRAINLTNPSQRTRAKP